MNQQSEHLSNAQIEKYGSPASGAGAETDEWVEQHLADCPSCRGRVLDFQRTRFSFLPDPNVNTALSSNCPSEDDLRTLAAGLCSDPLAAELTAHAAACGHCGPLLREYQEDFSDDITPEEQTALAQLPSASPEWQRKTAREMLQPVRPRPLPGPSPKPVPRIFPWKWVTAPAAVAAACVLLALGVGVTLYAKRDTPGKAEGLLAQAYTEQRKIEMRWPGAKWGSPQITLGPSESVLSKPGPFMDAVKMIKDHQTASSADSKWLRASAEAEILGGNPGYAIQLLEPVVQANPDSVPLLLDLALAYSLHNDSEKAVDLLNQVLKKEPKNRTALFNLAIAYEKQEKVDLAISIWENYLRLETDKQWSKEAKEKLDKAREKVHSGLQYPSSGLVTSFLPLHDDEIAFRLEQYQEIALRSWLANAIANPSGQEYRAIKRLAHVSEDHSHDLWWRDFIQVASNHDASGVAALSAAFVDNIKGHYAEAIKESARSEKIFKQQKNLPGKLRARLESVYAHRRLLRGRDCLARARPLRARLTLTSYTWMQSQLGMEMAICLNYVDDLKESDALLSQSLSIAQKSHLPIAALRNIGFTQSLNNQQGNYASALEEGTRGLQDYWQGPASTERIYQFYTGFSRTMQKLGLWAAAEIYMRHAVDLLQTEEDNIQKGAALLELAGVFAAEKNYPAADPLIVRANQLFDGESNEPTSLSYPLVGKIRLAEMQLRQGRVAEALHTLEPAKALLPETDPYFISLDFYRVSGNARLAAHDLDQAESAYQQAILIAERALPGLENNRRRLDWISAAGDAYRGLARVLIERDKPGEAWKLWEWYTSRSYPDDLTAVAGGRPKAVAGWPELWATISGIRPQSGPVPRLVYAAFDDGIEIWGIAQDKLKATWVPVNREKLQRMTQQFSQACAQKDSPLTNVQKLGQDLFALFVQPMSAELPPMSLIRIELDRSLSGLPIEALRSPDGWYFGERYPIIQSPGVLYERHLRPAVNLPSNASFLLADASADSYLPGHDLELSTIQGLFPGVKVLGPKTDSATIRTGLGQSAIFGFIGHGEPYATGAALRISPNLLLKAEDFPSQTLHHLQVAVLAACSTGSSGSDGLLDNRSLVHAFLAGGAPSVVASRWNVDSQSTAILMSGLYDRLAHNQSAPTALFSARNQLLKTYSHPYYWAGFSVTGKSN